VRTSPIKVVVLGMGNLLLKDEGIGVHVAHALQGAPSSSEVELEVRDGGTLPDALLSLEDVDKVVIVDAVQGGSEAGTIYRFGNEDVRLENRSFTSLHQMSLLESLWLTEKFGQKPKEVVIIGVEPEDMNLGLELSAKLEQKLPEIIEVVLAEAGLNHSDEPVKGR